MSEVREEINQEFGAAMRGLRQAQGIKTYELAVRIGMSPDTVGAYERGEGSPSLAIAHRIADELGTTLEAMLNGVAS